MANSLADEVIEHLNALPPDLQEQLLSLLRILDHTFRQGVPGKRLLEFAGAISASDLDDMSIAIEEGCERVDLDEW